MARGLPAMTIVALDFAHNDKPFKKFMADYLTGAVDHQRGDESPRDLTMIAGLDWCLERFKEHCNVAKFREEVAMVTPKIQKTTKFCRPKWNIWERRKFLATIDVDKVQF